MYNIIANFPIAFPKACFGVLATNNSPYNTTVAVGFAAPISTTQVNISFVRNDCDINMGVFYVAIGN